MPVRMQYFRVMSRILKQTLRRILSILTWSFWMLLQVWSGSDAATLIVMTSMSDSACGYNFQEGEEYLVYAYQPEYDLWTNNCTRTALLSEAVEDLAYLTCDEGYTQINGEDYCCLMI